MAEVADALLWSRLWLDDAPAGLATALAAAAKPRRLADGELLYAKGDAATGLIGVRRGLIRNVHVAADGRELLFGLFAAGSWFGEISLFDAAPRPLHAYAMGETEVLLVPTAAFHAALEAHPAGYRHFARVLCHKLRVAFEQLEEFQQPLVRRLGKRLLDLAAVYGQPGPQGVDLGLSLPQEDLARMLGATRQSINKALRQLAVEQLVLARAGRLWLRDPAALRARLDSLTTES
jgi:CRP-like cAMP-binding protein